MTFRSAKASQSPSCYSTSYIGIFIARKIVISSQLFPLLDLLFYLLDLWEAVVLRMQVSFLPHHAYLAFDERMNPHELLHRGLVAVVRLADCVPNDLFITRN
jgi:hypothetical protein